MIDMCQIGLSKYFRNVPKLLIILILPHPVIPLSTPPSASSPVTPDLEGDEPKKSQRSEPTTSTRSLIPPGSARGSPKSEEAAVHVMEKETGYRADGERGKRERLG